MHRVADIEDGGFDVFDAEVLAKDRVGPVDPEDEGVGDAAGESVCVRVCVCACVCVCLDGYVHGHV